MTDQKPIEPEETPAHAGKTHKSNKALITAIIVSAVLGVLLIASVAALTFSVLSHNRAERGLMQSEQRTMRPDSGMTGPSNERRNSRMENEPRGDSSTRVSGVVTAVNGDTITISGNGKQVQVKKTSTTTVRGSSTSVAVNDTVLATGTTTNGTFTATTITVRNIAN